MALIVLFFHVGKNTRILGKLHLFRFSHFFHLFNTFHFRFKYIFLCTSKFCLRLEPIIWDFYSLWPLSILTKKVKDRLKIHINTMMNECPIDISIHKMIPPPMFFFPRKVEKLSFSQNKNTCSLLGEKAGLVPIVTKK